jgi:hypothetical protein
MCKIPIYLYQYYTYLYSGFYRYIKEVHFKNIKYTLASYYVSTQSDHYCS